MKKAKINGDLSFSTLAAIIIYLVLPYHNPVHCLNLSINIPWPLYESKQPLYRYLDSRLKSQSHHSKRR
jgi:hypothetical protein